MFYLLTEGGSGTNEGINFSVSGLGITKSRRIAYKVLTGGYLTNSSNYLSACYAWIHAAEDLYGYCSLEALQTAEAWYATGVLPNDPQNFAVVCGTIATTTPVTRFGLSELSAAGSCITTITPSTNMATFSSSKVVLLKPGFTAPAGSLFVGKISACNQSFY